MKTPAVEFDYHLPEELIAQEPPARRGASRMLTLDRETGIREIRGFGDLPELVRRGDVVVLNDTRVIRARMFGRKEPSGAEIELLLVEPAATPNHWLCLARPGKRLREGVEIRLKTVSGELGDAKVTVTAKHPDGRVEIDLGPVDFDALQETFGHMPLPPYIKRSDRNDDRDRYQTVYARTPGAVAAPTAGLHFTPEILAKLADKGVTTERVTLHVGPGTFRPVSVEHVEDHQMHSERYHLNAATADRINAARAAGGRVLAVGTTVVRVLETIADEKGNVHPGTGETDIFIHPPYRFKAVDMLLTNFHLPKSTLLMLACAFAGTTNTLAAYEDAKRAKMRFYSYGDCMVVL